MKRTQLMALLTRAILDGWLTEEDASLILARYDRGELAEIDIPLAPEDVISGDSRGIRELALIALLASLGLWLIKTGRSDFDVVLSSLPSLTSNLRTEIVDILQTAFEEDVRILAEEFASGGMSLGQWQIRMANRIRQHLAEQTMLGLGTDRLSSAQLSNLDAIMRRETAYLSRFADQIAVAEAQGRRLSPAYIGNRAELYAGTARGEYFRASEEWMSGRVGWIIRYETRGDENVCSPCQNADGWYLIGQGPMPGQVCLGRSRCRCVRNLIYDPVRFAELTGGIP